MDFRIRNLKRNMETEIQAVKAYDPTDDRLQLASQATAACIDLMDQSYYERTTKSFPLGSFRSHSNCKKLLPGTNDYTVLLCAVLDWTGLDLDLISIQPKAHSMEL